MIQFLSGIRIKAPHRHLFFRFATCNMHFASPLRYVKVANDPASLRLCVLGFVVSEIILIFEAYLQDIADDQSPLIFFKASL